jgi:RHS repeat-associated protein
MKAPRFIILLVVLTVTTALVAQKPPMTNPVASMHAKGAAPQTSDEKKAKNLQKQWLNGLLLGKDLSNLSQSYATEIKKLSAKKSQQTPSIKRNNYQEIFAKDYAKYVQSVKELIKLDKKSFENKWQNKVVYLQTHYQRAKKAQKQLLKRLKAQKQILEDKKTAAKKTAAIDRNIKITQAKLTAATDKLLGKEGINTFAKRSDWHNFLAEQQSQHKTTASNEKALTLIRPTKILRNSSLPYAGREYSAPVLEYTPEITASYASQSPSPASGEDLVEDGIVQFSPAINQLAADLDNDYLKIVNYVRQTIKLQYYAGAQKGADATLRSLAGNDVDQAALLIALLRRSKVPARFVQGVIRQPIDQAMASIGISDGSQVLAALNRAGIAHQPIIEGGQLTAIHRHYTWVSAYIPYANYRGSVADLSDRVWIPIAPAIKNDNTLSTDYQYQDANLGADTLVLDYLRGSDNLSPLLFWRNQVQADISNHYPNLSYQELLERSQYNTPAYQLLPSSLPFEVIVTTSESQQLAAKHIQKLTIQMGTNAQYLDVTLLLPEIAGKRLSLSYVPATVDDLNIINQAGGMAAVQPYLVDLRPVIKVDGKQIDAINAALPMASFADVTLTFSSPAGAESFNRNTLIGNYLNLTVTTQSDNFALDNEDPNLFADETRFIRILHNLAKNYNRQWQEAEGEMAAIMDIALIKPIPALTIISPEYNLVQSQGLITELQFKGLSIDAVTNSVDAISRGNPTANQYDFYRLSSLHGSYLESNIVYTQAALAAVSADQGIRRLAASGPILHLTPDNYQAQLATSTHPQAVKQQIESWLQQGNHALLTATPETIDTWQGSSWVIYNPETGHSGYFISGIYAGCETVEDPNDWVNTDLFEAAVNPYSSGSSTNPFSARSLTVLEFTNNQLGTVNQPLSSPLGVIALDGFNNPVSNATVEFEIRIGTGELSTDDGGTSTSRITTTTDNNGIASVNLRFLQKIAGGVLYLLNPGDENLTQLGVTQISVAVDTDLGKIFSEGLMTAFAKPDEAAEITVTANCETTPLRGEECLTTDHYGGMKGKVHHFKVADQFGNFVSNVPIHIAFEFTPSTPESFSSTSYDKGFGPFSYFDKGKITMKSDCPEFGTALGPSDCAQEEPVDSVSNYFWTTFVPYYPILGEDREYYPPYDLTLSVSSATALGERNFTHRIFPLDNVSAGVEVVNIVYVSSNYFSPTGNYEAVERGGTVAVPRKYLTPHFFANSGDYRNLSFFQQFGFSRDVVADDDYPGLFISGSLGFTDLIIESVHNENDKNIFDLSANDIPALYSTAKHTLVYCVLPGGQIADRGIKGIACDPSIFIYPQLISETSPIQDSIIMADIEITDASLLFQDSINQFVKSPVLIKANILPAGFTPENIEVNIYKRGAIFSSSKIEYPISSSLEQIFTPDEERINGIYEVEIIINKGNPFEMRSQKQAVNVFSDNIVTSVSTSNTDSALSSSFSGGRIINGQIPSQLKLLTSIDLSDPLVCKDEGVELLLNVEAALTVSLVKLTESGAVPSNPSTQIIADGIFPAGQSIIPLSAEELGNASFRVQIIATSTANGNTETVIGALKSVFEIKDTLLIGHAVVKGVDLADGSMIYSKKDISLPAPGADLEFIHTYSNKSRYNLGPMGFGWSHNYMSRVFQSNCGRFYVTGADGGSARFRVVNGEIVPMQGIHSTLIANPGGSFSFYSKNGSHYHYVKYQNRVWWLDYIEDPNGNRLSINLERRENAPIIKSIQDSVGRILTFIYETKTINNAPGQLNSVNGEFLTSVIGPQGISLNFSYDNKGHLITAKRDGDTTNESYDYSAATTGFNSHLLTQITDNATLAVRQYLYEDKTTLLPSIPSVTTGIKDKQILSITETDGGSTGFSYTPGSGFNDAVSIDQNGTVSNYALNDYGAATSISSISGTKSMVWDIGAEILLRTETDENGRNRSFEYDNNANLSKETINGISRSYTYEPAQTTPPYIKDRIKTYTNWRGKTTTFQYDALGNKTRETLAGISTAFTYNAPGGLVNTITDGRGKTTIISYDNFGQVSEQTDAAGNTIKNQWDARGRKIASTDANGNTSTFSYDNSDRITQKTLSGDQLRTWLYDYQAGGLIKTETDPNQHVTTYSYDKMGRLLNIQNADENNYSYSYDFNGNKLIENDFNGNTTSFTYDSDNRLKTKTEPLAKTTTYSYDNVGNVLSETTANRVARYSYDPNRYFLTSFTGEAPATGGNKAATSATTSRTVDGEGNILSETDPNNNTTSFTYDAFNRLLTTSGPLGSGTTLVYDANGNIIKETSHNSTGFQIRAFTYDGANRKKTQTDAAGITSSFNYDGNGNILKQTRPQGNITNFTYNNLNLVKTKSIATAFWSFAYDAAGNLIEETLPNGNTITTDYDKLNRPINKQDDIGAISHFSYDGNSNLTTETDGNGNSSSYTYNALNQRITASKPLSRGHSFSYTVFGELLSDTGPNGTITYSVNSLGQRTSATGPNNYHEAYDYDANDNLTSFTDSRGNLTIYGINGLNQTSSQTTGIFHKTFTYDTLGNKLTETDYRGKESRFTYDKENRQTSFKRVGLLQQTTVYNDAGLAQSEKDANANIRVHLYNDQYYRTQTSLPETQVIKYTPDAFGDVSFQDNPGPNDITRVFDKRRRLSSETNGADEQTQYEYDLNNNRTAVIKPDNTRWEYTYDAANRLVSIKNTAENIETIYGYSPKDNLIRITDAENKSTEFSYDNRNRKLSKTYADGKIVNYTYDANGNLKTVGLPNGTDITYQYDILNRKTNEDYTSPYGSGSVIFTLDGNGNTTKIVETISGETFTTSQSFDDLDRLVSRTDVYGNVYNYEYDANGNRKTFKDHQNALTNYTFDGLNRLKQLTHAGIGTFNWNYNSAGLVDKIDYPNSTSINYLYDDANRIASIRNKKSGADITKHVYTYDLNGNRLTMRESNIHDNQLITYGYDKADRLTSVEYPNNERTVYQLDKVGNRTQETITGATLNTKTYSYNTRDQLTGILDTLGSSISYTFDDAGNQLTKDDNGVVTTFDYTARHRVRSITVGGQQSINYQYDYTGQRVNYQSNGIEKQYLYDGLTLIAETNTIGNTLARYVYGDRYQLAETRNNLNSYFHVDSLGTNVAVTNPDGSIAARYEYDAYGNLLTQAGSSETPFGFTGYQKDDETGLYYANARYYDSNTGRFLKEDPVEGNTQIPPSLHKYLYAFANPIVFVDPTGRESVEEFFHLKSFREMLDFDIPDDTDNSGRKSELITIKTAMEQQRIRSEGGILAVQKTNREVADRFTADAIKKRALDREMTVVAESASNAILLELNISPREVVRDAHLSSCIYSSRCKAIDVNVGDVRKLDRIGLRQFGFKEADLVNPLSGFKSGIFRDHDLNNHLIVSFAGTEDIVKDALITDGGNGIGIFVSQYNQALDVAKKISANAKEQGFTVSFTGHSLGGGLASLGSFATGENANTFNAAGIHPLTAIRTLNRELLETGDIERRPTQDKLINAFFVKGEVLSRVQDAIFGVPDAIGRRIPLQPGTSDNFFLQHGSANVCRSLGSQCGIY